MMKFAKVRVADLNPAPYNPRKDLCSEDKEFKQIKKSIEEFGYVDPIIVNADYTVIGGHQRLKVLAEMGYAELDVVCIDVPKTQEKALNITLNKLSGDWDQDKLQTLLAELNQEMNIEITGFDESFFDKALVELDEVACEYIQHDQTADKAGASPWDRMNNAPHDGVMFTCGGVTAKVDADVYSMWFEKASYSDDLKSFVEGCLRHAV